MPEKVDYLVFAPHPDDAEFSAAGSIALWIREGKKVAYVLCTNGEKGTSDPDIKPADLVKIREEEQRVAAKLLGVSDVVFLGFPDQELEDTAEFRKACVREIRRFQPDTVVTADPHRRYLWHRDHRVTGRVVLDAIFPYARDHHAYPDLIEEGLMPHKVKEVLCWASEDPNHWIDISDTFDLKIASIACHKSQIGEPMREEVIERVRERCVSQAEGQACELAEAYHREERLN